MTPVAAYYVLIVTDQTRAAERTRPYEAPVPRKSVIERVAFALEMLVSMGRPATTQPI